MRHARTTGTLNAVDQVSYLSWFHRRNPQPQIAAFPDLQSAGAATAGDLPPYLSRGAVDVRAPQTPCASRRLATYACVPRSAVRDVQKVVVGR